MRPADKHLTPQELQSLLFGTDDSKDNAGGGAAPEAQQHLSRCAVCQSVADKYRNVDSALKGLRTDDKRALKASARGTDCPPEQTWRNLAAGLIREDQAARYVSHAAQCDWCGPLLKESMEDLAQDATADEQEALDKLPSASPGWQRAMAQKMAAASRNPDVPFVEVEKPARNKESKNKEKAGFGWWPRLVWAGSGLAVVIVAVLVGVRLMREPDVNQLLAQTYSKHRTIELRILGALYGPKQVERGNGTTKWPTQFYEAQMILQRESAKHIEDPSWLQAQARADLLQWDYSAAIKELDEALMLKPNDPGLLIDRATAFFERAEKLGIQGAIDYGEAADSLTQVLTKNPEDPVALFNRAIVYEKLRLPNEAIVDLEHYLRIDPSGPWADEAKERLDHLKMLVKAHAATMVQPLATPEAFIRLASDPVSSAQIDERIEDYQDVAVKEWLPQAYFPDTPSTRRNQIVSALQVLGNMLATRHQDQWMNDLLAAANESTAFVSALSSLRDAILLSGEGDPSGAYSIATKSAVSFVTAGDKAGVLRAQIEQVHALQRSERGDRCLAKARVVEANLRDTNYAWINAQLAMDEYACSMKLGHFDDGRSYVSQALRQIKASNFPDLRLRGVGFVASEETFEGNLAVAWASNEEGLQEYWQRNSSPTVRAHQFYDDLTYASESLGWMNLAVAFAQESAAMVSLAGNRNVEILVRQHLADVAIRAGQLRLARTEMEKASTLITSSSEQSQQRSFYISSEITLAEIEIGQGMLPEAENRLKSVEAKLGSVEMLDITRSFHSAKAKLLALQAKGDEAEKELLHTIDIVDSSVKRLRTRESRESWNQENSSLYRTLVELEITKGDGERALSIWEWYRSGGFNAADSAETLRQFLDHNGVRKFVSPLTGQTIISYSLLPRGLAVWIADARGIKWQFTRLDSTGLAILASSFLSRCADPSSDISSLKVMSRRLFDVLIAPISEQLVERRVLVIEPDEIIGDLPFQVLLTPDSHYLIEKYAIVFSPGMLYTQYFRPHIVLSPSARALVVGSSASTIVNREESLQPDEDAMAEADDIAGRFAHAQLLKSADATRRKIEEFLPEAELFHFVGHALSDVTQDGLLVLTSSRDGGDTNLWSVRDLEPGLFSKCQLVVLSACSTGKTFRSRRETHGGTIKTMLAAGVSNVVASRWDVDSKSTRRLVSIFYSGLLSGKSVAAALRDAELELIGHADTEHPYYWASFVAFGRA